MTVLDDAPGWEDVGPDPEADYHRLRVHGLMVVGPGEGDRWLDACVRWLAAGVDTLFIYVDGPVDTPTRHVLLALADEMPTVTVRHRGSEAPTFTEHEARFRAGAWATWETSIEPEPGDWVFLPDADEFPVPRQRAVDLYDAIHASAGFAQVNGQDTVAVPIPEVWGFAPDRTPMIRVDGMWGGNAGPRLVRWYPEVTAAGADAWSDSPLGCGSTPRFYATPDRPAPGPAFFQLLHYGYAHVDDVRAKAQRYQSRADHGHNNAHVASITKPPRLEPVRGVGVYPTVWRGPRRTGTA